MPFRFRLKWSTSKTRISAPYLAIICGLILIINLILNQPTNTHQCVQQVGENNENQINIDSIVAFPRQSSLFTPNNNNNNNYSSWTKVYEKSRRRARQSQLASWRQV
jgi:hypothetical protein